MHKKIAKASTKMLCCKVPRNWTELLVVLLRSKGLYIRTLKIIQFSRHFHLKNKTCESSMSWERKWVEVEVHKEWYKWEKMDLLQCVYWNIHNIDENFPINTKHLRVYDQVYVIMGHICFSLFFPFWCCFEPLLKRNSWCFLTWNIRFA